jgi:hypothetical protein
VFGANSPVLIDLNNGPSCCSTRATTARNPDDRACEGDHGKTVGRGHPYQIVVTTTQGKLLLATDRGRPGTSTKP